MHNIQWKQFLSTLLVFSLLLQSCSANLDAPLGAAPSSDRQAGHAPGAAPAAAPGELPLAGPALALEEPEEDNSSGGSPVSARPMEGRLPAAPARSGSQVSSPASVGPVRSAARIARQVASPRPVAEPQPFTARVVQGATKASQERLLPPLSVRDQRRTCPASRPSPRCYGPWEVPGWGAVSFRSSSSGSWQAEVHTTYQDGATYTEHFPVVGKGDIGSQLSHLSKEAPVQLRHKLHLSYMDRPPYARRCVYLGSAVLRGGMEDEKEAAGPPSYEEALQEEKEAMDGVGQPSLPKAGWEGYSGPVGAAAPSYEKALQEEKEQEEKELEEWIGQHALGKAVWERYFGPVDAEPALPKDIAEILNSPCPFWKGKQVKDTHLLVLIPGRVNGKPLTLDYLGELIQAPEGGDHKTKYRLYADSVRQSHGPTASKGPYWMLMTRDVLEGSRRKTYEKQCALVAAHSKRTGISYEVPHALEAAVVMLLHHACSGERLYGDSPLTYTRCQEVVGSYPVVVGGFSSGGLDVDYSHYDSYLIGLSCFRKF